ncbi:putative leucine-rich repeat-containing protein DDB_G0290503 [Palaemon carinicauda]|uniref:putative leucine-rich repeat-containing protein DDB_G0290503 n=1 Tax=Palaemon carinicauda TaxID=392227 RepID=UPI0035B5FD69
MRPHLEMLERQIRLFNSLRKIVSRIEDKLAETNHKIEEMKWEMINKDEMICEQKGLVRECREEIIHFQKKIKEGEKREAELRKEIRNFKVHKLIPKQWNKVSNLNWNISNAIKKIFSGKEKISKEKESHFAQRVDDCKNQRPPMTKLREAVAREFDQGNKEIVLKKATKHVINIVIGGKELSFCIVFALMVTGTIVGLTVAIARYRQEIKFWQDNNNIKRQILEALIPRSETTRPEMALSGRVSCKREGENRNGKTLHYNSLGLGTPYDEIKPHWQCVQTLKEELDDSKMANRPFLNRLKRKDIKTKFELAKRTIENLKKEIVELDQNKEKRDNLVKELRFEIGVLRNLLSQNKKKLTKKRNKSLQLMLKTKIRMNMRNKQNAKYQKCSKKVGQLLKKQIVGKKRVAELEKQIKNLKVDRLISKHCDKVPNKKENKSIALKRTFFRKENFSKENESYFEQRLDDCKNQSHLMKMRREAVAREFAQRNKEIVLKKATTHLETASNKREVNLFRSIQRKWMERRIRRLFKISHPNNLDLLQAQKVIAILELQVKLRQRRRSHKDFKVLALYNDRARLRRLMAKNADDQAEENGMLEELEWTIQNLEEVISVLKGLVWERREEIRLLQKKIKEGKKHEAELKKEIRNLKVHKLISKHWNKVSNLNWNIFNAIKKIFSSKEKISKGKESHFEQRVDDCKNRRLEIEILREDIAREFAQRYLQLESLKRKVSLDMCQKIKYTTRMNTEKTQIEKKLHKENKKL